jgi:trimeric autotransporter adhesin
MSNLNVTTQNQVLDAYEDTISLAAGISVTIDGGGNNTVTGGTNDVVTVNNDENTITIGNYGAVIFGIPNAIGDLINASFADVFAIVGAGDSIVLAGDSNSLEGGTGGIFVADGDGNAIGAGADSTIIVTGNNNNVVLAAPVTPVVQPLLVIATPLLPTGDGNITLTGIGETVSASNAIIGLSANSSMTLTGATNTITGTTGDLFIITGDGNSLTAGTGATIQFLKGNSETAVASMGTISLGATSAGITTVANATVTGSHNAISMTEGSQMVVGTGLTGNNNTVTGTDVDVQVGGNNNTFNLTADPNNENGNPGVGAGRIGFYGTGETVNASYASIGGLQNVPGTSDGSSGPVHDSVTVNGTDNKIGFVANMTAEFGSTFNGDLLEDFSDYLKTAVIDFHGVSGLNSFASVLSHASQDGSGDTFITAGGNQLELYGVQISQLAAHNFSFT